MLCFVSNIAILHVMFKCQAVMHVVVVEFIFDKLCAYIVVLLCYILGVIPR